MKLTELATKIFTLNPKDFKNINSYILKEHTFILNRLLSSKFPLIANALNDMKISGDSVLKVWNVFLYRNFGGKAQRWIWTKTNKVQKVKPPKLKKSDVKKGIFKDFIPSKDVKIKYCEENGIDLKDLDYYLKVDELKTKSVLYHLNESIINNKNKEKMLD